MAKVRNFKPPAISPSFILNSTFSAAFSEDVYEKAANSFLSSVTNDSLELKLKNLLHEARFRSSLNCYVTKVEDFFSKPLYEFKNTLDAPLRVLEVLLIEQKELINKFTFLRGEFEHEVLNGKFERANQILDDCEELFGESFWLISNKLLLYSFSGNQAEGDEYADTLINRASHEFCKELIQKYRLLLLLEDSSLPMKNVILRTLREYKIAGFNRGASSLGLLYVPSPIIDEFECESFIDKLFAYPLIDQYVFIQKITQYLFVSKSDFLDKSKLRLKKFFNSISVHILDNQLEIFKAYPENVQIQSQEFLTLFNNYESGNYQSIVDVYEKNLNAFDNPISIINLVAKSYAYLNIKPGLNRGPIDLMVSEFFNAYTLASSLSEIEQRVRSLIIKLYSFSNWTHIQAELFILFPHKYEIQMVSKGFDLSLITTGSTNPLAMAFKSLDKNSQKLNYRLCFETKTLSESIPEYRKIKFKIIHLLNHSPERATELESLFKQYKANTLLLKDYLELYSDYCLITNQYEKLIIFCANELIRDTNLIFTLPVTELVDLIDEGEIVTLEALTVLYFFNKYLSRSKDSLLNEYFEMYLEKNHVELPSQLLERKSKELNELEVNFYKNICSLGVLDYLDFFSDSAELRFERLKLLELLLERGAINNFSRMEEVERILSQHIIESAATEFNSGKISVDDTEIVKSNIESVNVIIEQYRLVDTIKDQPVTTARVHDDSEVVLDQDSYKNLTKITLIARILSLLQKSFLNDEHYGLDKNLSTEIRHGFFANLFRATISNQHLLSVLNQKDEYIENEYWKSALSFVSKHFWNDIDQYLKSFSKDINQLLLDAEEWMQIRTANDQTKRVFDYDIDPSFVKNVAEAIDKKGNAIDVSNLVINKIWEMTERNLDNIKSKIRTEFSDRMEQIFQKLISDVTNAKKGAALDEFMAAINSTKGKVHEDINTTLGWFTRVYSLSKEDRDLFTLVEIAIHAFRGVSPKELHIDNKIPNDFRNVNISNVFVKSFILAIINLLDNSFRRSGLGNNTDVTIDGKYEGNIAKLRVINNLSSDKKSVLNSEYIASIQAKLRSEDSLELMKKEGGSGLVKACNQLKFVSSKTDLIISIQDDQFIVEIAYEL